MGDVSINTKLEIDLEKLTLENFEEYVNGITSLIRSDVERELLEKVSKAQPMRKLRRSKREKNILKMRAYIVPKNVSLVSRAGIPIQLSTVANSAIAKIDSSRALILLRVASIGSRFSRTFIASAQEDVHRLMDGVKINAKPLFDTILPYESVEDPRIDPEDSSSIYHVRLLFTPKEPYTLTFASRLGGDGRPENLEVVSFVKDGSAFILRDYRDTFPLNRRIMVVRPFISEAKIWGIFVGPRSGSVVEFKELEPIPDLLPDVDERKTGGNCAVKISSNEYMLIFHAVDRHGVYYHYVALFNDMGELLAMSTEPIISPSIGVYGGLRPSTVFACGAMLYDDRLLVSAGRDDEITIIFEGDLEEVLRSLTFLRG